MVSKLWDHITKGKSVFVIAEAGVNHNGKLVLARKLVDAACAAGADAVKFQAFDAERLASVHAPKARYQEKATGKGGSQLQMLRHVQLNEAEHRCLCDYCQTKKIIFLSTPFDEARADFLNALGVPLFKTPSGEMTNWPYLRHIARLNKPMIVSTGMADMQEVRDAVAVIRKAGNRRIALLHCVSSYPALVKDVNLKAMQALVQAFHVPVGFSDHTLGIDIPVAAGALGACIIEKHLTLDKNMQGPDHRMSLEPGEFKTMVDSIRRVSLALGNGIKAPAKSEAEVAQVARKSLTASHDITAGEIITREAIVFKRPGTGLAPKLITRVLGRRAKQRIRQDQMITLRMLS